MNATITNKGMAHEKIKAECFCKKCDAYFEVIYHPIPPAKIISLLNFKGDTEERGGFRPKFFEKWALY